ncbi:hypothetical protein VB695_21965 [Nodularia spumigena UHCC 0060]|uniref:Uncharacterized protein n=1 Tax=Nodularia spumigena UHCC 0060 TaxID=3110300 RepID=A0ABU5UWM8_NODSP|nr:hypothetical protein [Nodularia spumigena UHCC 0060]
MAIAIAEHLFRPTSQNRVAPDAKPPTHPELRERKLLALQQFSGK